MGLLDSIASGTRNLVWSIPGGRDAFPEGNNGTIWWGRNAGMGDHASGRTVLGAAGRGATGIDVAEAGVNGIRGMFGGNQPGTAPDRFAASTEAISQRAATARPPGSVVARGYIGQRGMTRQPEQRNVLGYRIGESPASERDPNWRMPGVSDAAPPAPSGGDQHEQSTVHVSGGDVSLAEHMARQRIRAQAEQ